MDNKKILKYGSIITIIAIVFSIFNISRISIKEPILIKKYIENPITYVDMEYPPYRDFYLIRNKSDQRVITSANMIEKNTKNVMVYENDYSLFLENDSQIRQISNININYLNYRIRSELEENEVLDFNKIDYVNPDGTEGSFDIGRIIYYEEDEILTNDLLINSPSSQELSSSSKLGVITDHSSSSFEAVEDLEIVEIKSELISQFDKYLDLTVNGVDYKDISGMKISKGEEIFIDSVFEIDTNSEYIDFNVVDITGKLIFKDNNENLFERSIGLINFVISDTQLNLPRIISENGDNNE